MENPTMTIAELSLFAAMILAVVTIFPAKAMGRRDFDNANPRSGSFYTAGFRARSLGAHQNGLETFPFFAVAVLLAEMHGTTQGWVDMIAVGFVIARVAYVTCYLADRPTARSIIWSVGFVLNLVLFFSPALVGH
jgi:uncharacterized MAPEG superfamily protein